LALCFDPERLRRDLERVDGTLWRLHEGPYHDGGWESVSLWAPGGDPGNQRTLGGALAATPVLESCHYFREVIDAFPLGRSRVRLMRLRPGAHIRRHYDPVEQVAAGLLRLHVPITTSDEVHFELCGHRLRMRPGEVWHLDVRFRHEVRNRSSRDRVHLVLDLVPIEGAGAGLLAGADVVAREWLTGYVLLQWLPGRIRSRMGLAN
jgi:hypothetical protein